MPKSKLKPIINCGDTLVYCPTDMDECHHDIGIVYKITENHSSLYKDKIISKSYWVFWNRTKDHMLFAEHVLYNRLSDGISSQYMKLIKSDE